MTVITVMASSRLLRIVIIFKCKTVFMFGLLLCIKLLVFDIGIIIFIILKHEL